MAQGKTTNPATIFDDHNPPAAELYNKCVHCGFCLPTCPTYALWGEEMDSPRGRIYLMKLGSEGKAKLTDSYARHFDQCLGCMACMTACPSGVQYGKLIEATRAQIERNYPRSWAERVRRNMGVKMFTSPSRLAMARGLASAYQKSGLRAAARALGVTRLLPKHLRSLESLMPQVRRSEKLPELVPAQGTKRMRVGVVLGCVQDAFFSHVNAATARVLAAEGCEVVMPQPQPCCGALMIHTGAEQQALALARQLIDTFERANVEAVVVNAAGCGSNVKDYGYLLRNTASGLRISRANPAMSPSSSPGWNRARNEKRCRSRWRITMPATCSTRKASRRRRASCLSRSPDWNCWNCRNRRSAAGRRECTTWRNRRRPRRWAIARQATCSPQSPTWWQPEIQDASCRLKRRCGAPEADCAWCTRSKCSMPPCAAPSCNTRPLG